MDYDSKIYSIAKSCPWYDLQQRFGPPNVKWCEETLCQYITEPANTWSNLGYMLLSFIIIYLIRKNKVEGYLKLYAPIVFIMGLFSFIYHFSLNYLTQYLDFFGMYFFIGIAIVGSLSWNKQKSVAQASLIILAVVVVNSLLFALFPFIGIPIQTIIGLNVLFAVAIELRNKFVLKINLQYKNLVISLCLFSVAHIFQVLDLKRILCDPTNHFFQGHAMWHLIGGVGSLFVFLHYSQKRES
ncbi:MAG: hypothetical protein HOE90_07310 [Bacteriovoracaceae bacterium]|jgi:hypothetical protein|nr:hypothetical protein [Bacteriovoracaceae bacterium]